MEPHDPSPDLSDAATFTEGPSGKGVFRLSWRAAWIAGIYAAVSLLWIFFSDQALGLMVENPDRVIRLSVYKGFAFVTLTAALIYLMMRNAFGTIEHSHGLLMSHEEEIGRLNRLYSALSRVNQAISRCKSREDLFRNVCQALGEQGGFQLVWIGTETPAPQRLKPVATWGDEKGILLKQEIKLDDPQQESGPSESAFRDNRPYIQNDALAENPSATWRKEIERKGIRASASFPFHEANRVVGTLNVYAKEGNFFKVEEIRLLVEVANDLSSALDTIEDRETRRLAEQQAENERAFSSTMIESMPGILFFYDESGRFLRWNRNFELISGYSGAEVAAMHPLDFFPDEEKEKFQRNIDQVFERGESSCEGLFRTKEGELIPHFFTGRKVMFNQKPCLIGMGVDISGQKQAQEELRKLNHNLERIVGERTEELEKALVQAESADKLKSAFLATMSHELRTPLNSIIGFTGIIQQGLAGDINAEQHKQLGMVRVSARHLLELINDVLDISKIEAGQLEVRSEPFELNAVIDDAAALVQSQLEQKHLAFHWEPPPGNINLESDARRVKQILLNLLNNAIKFTEQGEVRLEVKEIANHTFASDKRTQPAVQIRVSDTGIGIHPRELETIFQPFRQIDTGLSRQHEGTGLGLAICLKLAGLLAGELSVDSVWSEGSQFTLILPRIPAKRSA
ncbi:MAG: ATP-binding protein [Kiritimatiellia bacterium]